MYFLQVKIFRSWNLKLGAFPSGILFFERSEKRGQMLIRFLFLSQFCLWADTWFDDQLALLEVPVLPTLGSLHFLS